MCVQWDHVYTYTCTKDHLDTSYKAIYAYIHVSLYLLPTTFTHIHPTHMRICIYKSDMLTDALTCFNLFAHKYMVCNTRAYVYILSLFLLCLSSSHKEHCKKRKPRLSVRIDNGHSEGSQRCCSLPSSLFPSATLTTLAEVEPGPLWHSQGWSSA